MGLNILSKLIIKDDGSVILKKVGKEAETQGKRMERAAKKASGGWEKVKNTAKGVVGAYLGFRAISAGISIISDFEEATIDMGKVTSREFSLLKQDIASIDPVVGSSTELMKGYYQVISAGVTEPKEALEVLVVASKAAKAAHISQSETIKGLTKIMAGYEGEIKSVSDASDLLFAIEKEGQTSVGELIPVIGGLAKISKEASISQQEMGASLALISQTAGSTAEAATRFRAVVVALLKPTQQLEATYEKMGVTSFKAAVEQDGFSKALQNVRSTGKDLGFTMTELFGRVEGFLAQSALAANNFEDLAQKQEAMVGITGNSAKAFDEYSQTIKALWETFKNTLIKGVVEFSESSGPALTTSIIGLIEVAKEFGSILSGVWEIFSAIPVGIIDFFKDYGEEVDKAKDSTDEFLDESKVTSYWDTIKNFLGNFKDAVVFLGKVMGIAIGDTISGIIDQLKNMADVAKGIGNILIGTFTFDQDAVLKGMDQIKDGIVGTGLDAVNRTKAAAKGISDAWGDMVESMEKRIADSELGEIVPKENGLEEVKKEVKELNKKLDKTIKVSAELQTEWDKLKESMEVDIKKMGLSEFDKKMLDIGFKVEKLKEKFKDVAGAPSAIDAWKNKMIDSITQVEEAKLRELEVGIKIHEINLAEQTRSITEEEAINRKMTLTQELIGVKEVELQKIKEGTQEWFSQKEELAELRSELISLGDEMIKFTGTPMEGIKEGFKTFIDGVGTEFEIMATATNQLFSGLQGQISTVFGDAMRGELKSAEDYWNSFRNVVINALSEMIAKQLIMNSVQAAGAAFGGGGGGLIGGIAGLFAHNGGQVGSEVGVSLPKKHNGGGIRSDERLVVGQTGEGFVSRKGMNTLDKINNDELNETPFQPNIIFKVDTMDAPSFDQRLFERKDILAKAIMSVQQFNHPIRRGR